jgi:hypothetical protein
MNFTAFRRPLRRARCKIEPMRRYSSRGTTGNAITAPYPAVIAALTVSRDASSAIRIPGVPAE